MYPSFYQGKIYADICGSSQERGVKWKWGRRKWRLSILSLAISFEPSHPRP